MPSNPQILSDLRVVKETSQQLELLNTYKGVPFICPAKIVDLNGEQAVLQTDHPSLVCLQPNNQALVLGSDYFEPALAQVTVVDLSKGLVTLTGFVYAGTHMGDRTIVRVEPKEPLPAELSWEYPLTGETGSGSTLLADLSLNGIGLRYPVDVTPPGLKPGANVTVEIRLPDSGLISPAGVILSVTRRENHLRLAARFNPDNPYKVMIFRYLADRRTEIEVELRQAYIEALG